MPIIHFGTSGWRDIIAEGFTFTGVTALTRAVARQLKVKGLASRGVLVGHDTRFLSEEFAWHTAQVLSQEGLPVRIVEAATPTPVLATSIQELKLAGGINLTASHNPPKYQGYKFSNAHGGPATKEEVAPIERWANQLLRQDSRKPGPRIRPGKIISYDPKPAYFRRLLKLVARDVLHSARLSVIADPLYGAGRGYLDAALQQAGCRVQVMHNWRDAFFGGHSPEPDAENLQAATAQMKQQHAQLTLGTDGDADRFGIVDQDGTFITPNQVLALTVYLLVHHRHWQGRIVRSIATSHFVDALAKQYGLPVEVTPVGFKYISESMLRGGFLVGGEESGGLTIAGHVPEKDGILACLLMAELVAREKQPLGATLRQLYQKVGLILSDRINLQLSSQATGLKIQERLHRFAPRKLAGQTVKEIITVDGFKYILQDGSWLAIRLSGTEPVARLYLEAFDKTGLKRLTAAGRKLLAHV